MFGRSRMTSKEVALFKGLELRPNARLQSDRHIHLVTLPSWLRASLSYPFSTSSASPHAFAFHAYQYSQVCFLNRENVHFHDY